MSVWDTEELDRIRRSDDLHIAPFRADGKTCGTLTWIWSVVVDGQLFVRAYNGRKFRWYQSAISQRAGRIQVAGMLKEVSFEMVDDASLNDQIDDAYSMKYADSRYLAPMINPRTREATILIKPKS